MDDRSGTVETYERVADRYRERHADRDVVADLVERFLDALDAHGTSGDGEAPGRADEDDERRFVYWRADDVRDLARAAGFQDVAVDADGDWLQVLATV